jgi:hypothetical protein
VSKAGGGGVEARPFKLTVDHDRREIRAKSGNKNAGYLTMERYGDAAKNNEVFNMAVKPEFQRQGLMRQMHEIAEAHFGPINPSRTLSDDGFKFWENWRPSAVKNSYRFYADNLINKSVTHPSGEVGHVISVGDKSITALRPSTGTTFQVPSDQVDALVGAAQSQSRDARATGGLVSDIGMTVPEKPVAKAGGGGLSEHAWGAPEPATDHIHEGPIHSPVAGRTDHLPMHVASGSYVIPADIISAMGEGNTMAGFKQMRRMFTGAPYSASGTPYTGKSAMYGQSSPDIPYGPHDDSYAPSKARGGSTGTVPIVAAGGEYVLSPKQVMEAGGGDLDAGHRVLDDFVKRMRSKTIKTLKALPGPKKD